MFHCVLRATQEGNLAQCKLCERSGWLLQVDGLGLCPSCSMVAGQHINDHTRILLESLKIIDSSRSYSTIFSRIGVAARSCDALAVYAEKGVLSLNRHPGEVRRDIEATFKRCVHQAIELSVDAGREKALNGVTDAAKLAGYTKGIEVLAKLAAEFPAIDDLGPAILAIREERDAVRFQLRERKAEIAAAKGKKKQAVEILIEALLELKHDATPDQRQGGLVERGKRKIAELGGDPPIM